MENRNDGDSKNISDRDRFENIEKIEVPHLVIKSGKPGRRSALKFPDLKSPDERNPKWVPDPDEVRKNRKTAIQAAKKSNKED